MVQLTKIAVLLPAVLMVASGCATKDWVRDLMGKNQAETDQRVDQKVDGVNTRVDGVDKQVKAVEASLGDTTQLARGANEKADAAMTKAGNVDSRLTRIWSNRYNQKAVDTVDIYFGFNQADLSDGAQTALLGVVKELDASPTLVVRLGGFTDSKGSKNHNYLLAQRRVESVRRFLAEKGVQLSRVQAIGMGTLDDPAVPEDKKRRVTVTLMVDQD
jgi:outer membrane protein OmpA-like peptidoglycan-associated protein